MFPCFTTNENNIYLDVQVHLGGSMGECQFDDLTVRWIEANELKAPCLFTVPNQEGSIKHVILWCEDEEDLSEQIVKGVFQLPKQYGYRLQGISEPLYEQLALYWGMQAYQFKKYKESQEIPAQLYLPDTLNTASIFARLKGIYLTRDLINTPTEDLNTVEFAKQVKEIALQYDGKYTEVIGKQLLKENYPAIHAVGRASESEPRLAMFAWGDPNHKKLSLVGKGVCFDSGGLNLKPGKAMGLMKKDMGGAANALGLAVMIMELNLPLYLNVYLPLAENAIAGNAFRPGDVLQTRKGLTVEVTNTDAEGRLVLSDALAKACEQEVDLLIDFATLTGAARVAVGTDMPAFFTHHDELAHKLVQLGDEMRDWLWRLPLHQPYKKMIQSKVADLDNSGASPYAGSITAALFLEHFVMPGLNWLHFDMMAYNLSSRPGHPEGGEAQGLRTLLHYIENEFISDE